MKLLATFAAMILTTASLQVKNQDTAPKDFSKGSVSLADYSVIEGYIKDDIRSRSAVAMIPATGGKKKSYDGDKLNGATIEKTQYLCIKWDSLSW